VAETQEPATNFGSKETETLAAATQHSEAETQQPATDIDIEIQDLEVEGAETLLSLHQEAETQASEAIPVAAPQEPAKETMTVTQEPVIPKSKPTMADVLQENELLKSQLETLSARISQGKGGIRKGINSVCFGTNSNPGGTNYRKHMQGIHVLPMRKYLLSGRV
jgi:hypothetical protein